MSQYQQIRRKSSTMPLTTRAASFPCLLTSTEHFMTYCHDYYSQDCNIRGLKVNKSKKNRKCTEMEIRQFFWFDLMK